MESGGRFHWTGKKPAWVNAHNSVQMPTCTCALLRKYLKKPNSIHVQELNYDFIYFLPISDTYQIFHTVRTTQFWCFQIWLGPLSNVALNRICMQCTCSMNAHPYTSDLYVIQIRMRGQGGVLGRDTADCRPWIYKAVLSHSVVFIFDVHLIPLETGIIMGTFVVIVEIQPRTAIHLLCRAIVWRHLQFTSPWNEIEKPCLVLPWVFLPPPALLQWTQHAGPCLLKQCPMWHHFFGVRHLMSCFVHMHVTSWTCYIHIRNRPGRVDSFSCHQSLSSPSNRRCTFKVASHWSKLD